MGHSLLTVWLTDITWGTVRHLSHVFNARIRPLPVVHFPPQLVAFPVCGWSVCLRAQADTKRHTERQMPRQTVVTSSSLRWLHRGRLIWLPITSEYYVHGQT